MSKLHIVTNDEESPMLLHIRVNEALEPQLEKLDTVNQQYLITVEIVQL